jgi:hypothetical protein
LYVESLDPAKLRIIIELILTTDNEKGLVKPKSCDAGAPASDREKKFHVLLHEISRCSGTGGAGERGAAASCFSPWPYNKTRVIEL